MTKEKKIYKAWTDEEDMFLLAALDVAKMNDIPKSRLAWTFIPLLGRTEAAIATRLSELSKPADHVPKKRTVRKKAPEPDMDTTKEEKAGEIPYELIGQIVDVEVYKIVDFGAFCRTDGGHEGLLHISELIYGHVSDVRAYLREGDRIKAKVILSRVKGKPPMLGFSARQAGELQPRNDYVPHMTSIGEYLRGKKRVL